MTVEDFAREHRLKVRLDECGDRVIPGRMGDNHIYFHSSGRLGVMFMPDPKALDSDPHSTRWNNRRRKLIAAGCLITNDSDGEGAATFDPENVAQAKAAMSIAGIRP